MKAQRVLCGSAGVFGAMQRASKEVLHSSETAHKSLKLSAPKVASRPASSSPSVSSAPAFIMPCFAQLAMSEKEKNAKYAIPTEAAGGGVTLRAIRDVVDHFLHDNRGPSSQPLPVTPHTDTTTTTQDEVVAEESETLLPEVDVATILDALEGYNPTLDPRLIALVSQRVAVPAALQQARRLLELFTPNATAPGNDGVADTTLDAFVALLRRWRSERQRALSAASPTASVAIATEAERLRIAEEEAGILVRLHLGQGTSRQRLAGVLADAGDVQINEVLSDGQVVTFTHATLPAEETAVEWKGKHRHNLVATLETLLAGPAPPSVVYLHCILYKHDVPLHAVIRFLCDVVGDDLLQPGDFQVQQVLDDTAVTVQTCAVRVAVPATALAVEGAAVDYCRHIARRLLEINVVGAAAATAGEDAADASVPVAIQLLDWLPTSPHARTPQSTASASATAAAPAAQYTFLVRGVRAPRGSPPHHIERAVQRSLAAIPNFFAPVHFGPAAAAGGASCPFKTYHVSAALAHGQWAEGLMMALVLSLWGRDDAGGVRSASAAWVSAVFAAVVVAGEDRPAVLRSLWHTHVPEPVRRHFSTAASSLLWNVLASCRLQEWKQRKTGKDVGVVDGDLALDGDFVWAPSPAVTAGSAAVPLQVPPNKSERALMADCFALTETDVAGGESESDAAAFPPVRPLFTAESGAAQPSMRAVVVPLPDPSEVTQVPAMKALGVALGLLPATPTRAPSATQLAPPRFRPLLLQGSGYPQAERPWVKSFAEPSQPGAMASGAAATRRYQLATDAALAEARGSGRDYAAASRGQQGVVWPLGRRGRPMADRLPAGLLAATSLAAPPSSHVSAHGWRAHDARAAAASSRCLAVHLTLPAAAYTSDFLRECLFLEDRRPHSTRPLTALRRRLGLEPHSRRPGATEAGENSSSSRGVSPALPEDVEEEEEEEVVDGNLLLPRGGNRRR